MKIGVIDYGGGNVSSVINSLEYIGVKPLLVRQPDDLSSVDRIILPGVGNFSDSMRLLESGGWVSKIKEEVIEKKKPILGICVGMQILASYGAEGASSEMDNKCKGLDLISGSVEHLSMVSNEVRVPHMGWNSLKSTCNSSGLFSDINPGSDFYFLHSYYFRPDDPSKIAGTVEYGGELTAAIVSRNICGVQFHPEKSSREGLRLLNNFIYKFKC